MSKIDLYKGDWREINYVTQRVLRDIVGYTWFNLESLYIQLQDYTAKLLNYPNTKPYLYHALDLVAIEHGIDFDVLNSSIEKHKLRYKKEN